MRDDDPVSSDDMPDIDLLGWEPGRVLSKADVKCLRQYIEDMTDEALKEADIAITIADDTLRRVGGQELVDAVRDDDAERFREIINSALMRYHQRKAERLKTAN